MISRKKRNFFAALGTAVAVGALMTGGAALLSSCGKGVDIGRTQALGAQLYKYFAFVTRSGAADAISSLSINVDEPSNYGRLTAMSQVSAGDNPKRLAATSNAKCLYVTHNGANTLGVYKFNMETGNMVLEQTFNAVNAPTGVTVMEDRFVFVATTGNPATIMSYVIKDTNTCRLDQVGGGIQASGTANNSPQEIVVSPNKQFLVVSNQTSNTISSFTIRGDGSLTFKEEKNSNGADTLSNLVFNKTGDAVFVATLAAAAASALQKIAVNSVGSFGGITLVNPGGFNDLNWIAISDDSNFLIGASGDATITGVITFNNKSGTPAFGTALNTGGAFPSSVVFMPDNIPVAYAVNNTTGIVSTLFLDGSTAVKPTVRQDLALTGAEHVVVVKVAK